MALGESLRDSRRGLPGRRVVTVFGPSEATRPRCTSRASGRCSAAVAPPDRPREGGVLALEGVEAEAAEAGTVSVSIGSRPCGSGAAIPPPRKTSPSWRSTSGTDQRQGSYPAAGSSAWSRWERVVSARLQSGAQSVLRLQLGLPLSGTVGRNTIEARVEAGETYSEGSVHAPAAEPPERGAPLAGVPGGLYARSSPEAARRSMLRGSRSFGRTGTRGPERQALQR